MQAPTLRTERVQLNTIKATDLDAFSDIWADPAVTDMVGVPARDRSESWASILKMAGNWVLLGYGMWAIRDLQTGELWGQVGFFKALRGHGPAFDDLPEAGWVLAHAAFGRGIGSEAAIAAHAWFDAHVGGPTVCQIDARNKASQALASKLGYTKFDEIGPKDTPDHLYLYRRG